MSSQVHEYYFSLVHIIEVYIFELYKKTNLVSFNFCMKKMEYQQNLEIDIIGGSSVHNLKNKG